MVHLSDISWTESGEEAIRNYSKGDTVEAVVLSVDAEANRISLGIKQLNSDPFNEYLLSNDRGAIVKGTVKEVDAKGAVITLADEVEGYLRVADIARERTEDASKVLSVGDEVEAKIVGVDRKSRNISLSIKAKMKLMSVKPLKSFLIQQLKHSQKHLAIFSVSSLKVDCPEYD